MGVAQALLKWVCQADHSMQTIENRRYVADDCALEGKGRKAEAARERSRLLSKQGLQIGAAFLTLTIPLEQEGQNIKFECWDTAGQERYKSYVLPLTPLLRGQATPANRQLTLV